mgnify:CR=1 FL=1
MLRTINHTHRKKVYQGDFTFFLHKRREGHFLEVQLGKFNGNQFPADAQLIIEAHANITRQRIYCGSIKELSLPKNKLLDEIDISSRILFDVKVVDVNKNNGGLLALGKRFSPKGDELDSEGNLLPIKLIELEEMLWEVNFDNQKTTLYINNKFPALKNQLINDPLIQGLILPKALRDILIHYCIIENDEHKDKQRWIEFSEKIWETKPSDDDEDFDELIQWIDDVVKEFCKEHEMLKRIQTKGQTDND